jgi:predicted acylesterase/phospholipase RssA
MEEKGSVMGAELIRLIMNHTLPSLHKRNKRHRKLQEECNTSHFEVPPARWLSQPELKSRLQDFPYEYLVCEGGGILGCAELGIVLCFEHFGLLDNFKKFAGSSAGALLAAACATNHKPSNIANLLLQINFINFYDRNPSPLISLLHLIFRGGFYEADVFEEFLIAIWGTNTLLEWYNKTKKELIITAYSTRKRRTLFLSYRTAPDMPLYLALKASCSVPGLFPRVKWKGDELWDGGFLTNQPMFVFNQDSSLVFDEVKSRELPLNPKTLGLHVTTSVNERRDQEVFHHDDEHFIHGLASYWGLSSALREEVHRLNVIQSKQNYWNQVISVCGLGFRAVDIDVTLDQKLDLLQRGFVAGEGFLQDWVARNTASDTVL